jgi:hypothetical protein
VSGRICDLLMQENHGCIVSNVGEGEIGVHVNMRGSSRDIRVFPPLREEHLPAVEIR